MSASMMALDTVPSMLFLSAMCCVFFGYMQKPVCKSSGFSDECSNIAELSFPVASIIASSAMCLCCMTHMGMLGRGSTMGAYGGGGYGMY